MHADRLRYCVEPQDGDVVVDNSIMKAVFSCSTLAALEYGLGLKAKGQGAPLLVGQAGHAAMAEWLDTRGDVAKAMGLFRREYDKGGARVAVAALRQDDRDRARLDHDRVAVVMRRWFQEQGANWPLIVEPGDTELPVSAPLMTLADGRRVVYVALLDALAKRRKGGYFSVDHKFRHQVSDWWKEKQEDASQFTGHLWLAGEWELPVGGVYVNAIELPHARVGKSKCKEHGVPYFECDLKHANHRLIGPLTKSPAEIAAWRQTLERRVVRWVKLREQVKRLEDIHLADMEGRFNESCTFCAMKRWCRLGRPVGGRGDWFVEERWDPLKERRSV